MQTAYAMAYAGLEGVTDMLNIIRDMLNIISMTVCKQIAYTSIRYNFSSECLVIYELSIRIWALNISYRGFFTDMINLNLTMDKYLHPFKIVGYNLWSIPEIQRLQRQSFGMDKWFNFTL